MRNPNEIEIIVGAYNNRFGNILRYGSALFVFPVKHFSYVPASIKDFTYFPA
ncbi:hypothetical protein J2S74_002547 [Evansella vedderi]|uniref:Uncharacterized protein n=1 Tax=Evansella vedderi TaxID=38282 RepID=A0ABT9ZV95_9BACI|nr:hypothetical protein [Evansella vedderi]